MSARGEGEGAGQWVEIRDLILLLCGESEAGMDHHIIDQVTYGDALSLTDLENWKILQLKRWW